MSYEIKQYTSHNVAHKCAEYLFSICSTSTPVLLFISGGSSFQVLTAFSQILMKSQQRFNQLTIAFVDERFDSMNSNYVTLERDFFDLLVQLTKAGVSFIDTTPTGNDQFQMAKWYDSIVKNEITKVKKASGSVVCLLGMGPDGHIAGILPYPEDESVFNSLFIETDKFVVGYDGSGKNEYTQRYTLTFPGLETADYLVAFVKGESKKEKLAAAVKQMIPLHILPASFFRTSPTPCVIYTDLLI